MFVVSVASQYPRVHRMTQGSGDDGERDYGDLDTTFPRLPRALIFSAR